jgi:hypothetical protein
VAVFSVSRSPLGCPAPVPGVVASLAVASGGSFVGVRPSARSFSRWVVVVWFGSSAAADSFAGLASSRFGFPFCSVRACGSWWCVSVPASVRSFSVVGRSLPCLVVAV